MYSSHIVAGRWSHTIDFLFFIFYFFGVIKIHNYDYTSLEVAQIS